MSDLEKTLQRAKEKSELHRIVDMLDEGDSALVVVVKDDGEHSRFEAMCFPQSLGTHTLLGQLEHVKYYLLSAGTLDDE